MGALLLTIVASHASVVLQPRIRPGMIAGRGLEVMMNRALTAFPLCGVAWASGFIVFQALLGFRLVRLGQLVRDAEDAPPNLRDAVADFTDAVGIPAIAVCVTAAVDTPLIAGCRHPVLVLPRDLADVCAREQRRALIEHELAHVSRRDYRNNLLQLLAVSLLWWHPAVWWIYRQVQHERECCCDELAARWTGSALSLARALFKLAQRRVGHPAMAMGAWSTPLTDRLRRLSVADRSEPGSLSHCVALAAFPLCVSLVLAASASAASSEPLTRAFAASRFGPRDVITISAQDPAGHFTVQMLRGRVVSIMLGRNAVPSARVVQDGERVRIVDSSGQDVLALELDPRGGMRWNPRRRMVE